MIACRLSNDRQCTVFSFGLREKTDKKLVKVQVTRVHPHIYCKNSHKIEIMTLEWCN